MRFLEFHDASLEWFRVHHSIAYSRMMSGFEFSEEESGQPAREPPLDNVSNVCP